MEKETKKYNELNEIQRLKVKKVLMYRRLKEKAEDATIVLENGLMKYIFINENMIDITY